jgi:hypothetical protein
MAINIHFTFLFSMQNVHPPNGLSVADLPQVDLGGFQVLMPEQNLSDDLKGNPIAASVRHSVPSQIMR